MSMIICEGNSNGCCELIDSDADPDCFVEIGNLHKTLVLCCSCRDQREAELEDSSGMPPNHEFTPAQQAIIDAHEEDEP